MRTCDGNHSRVEVRNGLTLANGHKVLFTRPPGWATLNFTGNSQTLGGSGEVVLPARTAKHARRQSRCRADADHRAGITVHSGVAARAARFRPTAPSSTRTISASQRTDDISRGNGLNQRRHVVGARRGHAVFSTGLHDTVPGTPAQRRHRRHPAGWHAGQQRRDADAHSGHGCAVLGHWQLPRGTIQGGRCTQLAVACWWHRAVCWRRSRWMRTW